MIDNNKYDKDYFENGLISGVSCYLNYRWLPELTIKMAHNLIKKLEFKNKSVILDFGCAKGYLVKALRILDINAYGCDSSEYAISNSDAEVRSFCKLITKEDKLIPFDIGFDWIITKDVLEHLDELMIDNLLIQAKKKTSKMFHVIPLGDENDKFIIPEYEKDKTHILAKTKEWWIEKFNENGWRTVSFDYNIKGLKDNWTQRYEKGNGFFILKYGN